MLLLLLLTSPICVDCCRLLSQLAAHQVHLGGGRNLLHLLQLRHGHRRHAQAGQTGHFKVLRLHRLVEVAADVVLREGLHTEGLGKSLILCVPLRSMIC